MTNPIKTPSGYSPKLRPEILSLAQAGELASDTISDPFAGGEPPRTSNRITGYRRIQNWENYFLCSGICSVGKAVGSPIDDFHFYSAFTGDMFTYLYSEAVGNPEGLQCDSGVTNYFFAPQLVKNAYAAFGRECLYLSAAQIKRDFKAVMNAIRASVDRGIPVLAWGMGNVTMGSGNTYLPEGCLIGGYDEGDVLYVNLYPGQERLPAGSVDSDGYSAITHGLDTTNGLFFVGGEIETDMRAACRNAIEAIPAFLTLLPAEGRYGGRYVFGRQAFDVWAETLETDGFFEGKTDDELNGVCWNLHCSPYCCVCTSTADEFMSKAAAEFPDLTLASALAPLYGRMRQYKDDVWSLHGGFFPPMDKFRTHEFRAQIAAILRKMGELCGEIAGMWG